MNLEFVGKYESKFEAGKCIGLSNSAVSKGTRMTHNYSHGYFWSTVELTIEELKKKYSMIDFKRIVDRKKK